MNDTIHLFDVTCSLSKLCQQNFILSMLLFDLALLLSEEDLCFCSPWQLINSLLPCSFAK